MTPAEKAKELVDKFYATSPQVKVGTIEQIKSGTQERVYTKARINALIAVEEILKIFEGLHKPEYVSFDIYEPKQYHMEGEEDFNGYTMSEYFQQVKEEINKL